jgi:hypothetical protein
MKKEELKKTLETNDKRVHQRSNLRRRHSF